MASCESCGARSSKRRPLYLTKEPRKAARFLCRRCMPSKPKNDRQATGQALRTALDMLARVRP